MLSTVCPFWAAGPCLRTGIIALSYQQPVEEVSTVVYKQIKVLNAPFLPALMSPTRSAHFVTDLGPKCSLKLLGTHLWHNFYQLLFLLLRPAAFLSFLLMARTTTHTLLGKLTIFPNLSVGEMIAIAIAAVFVHPTNTSTNFRPFLTKIFHSAVMAILLRQFDRRTMEFIPDKYLIIWRGPLALMFRQIIPPL